MKKVSLGVTEFALPAPRVGSIDVNSGYGRGTSTGSEIHLRTQALRIKLDPLYKAEIMISHTFERAGYRFEIGGRMDGFFDHAKPKIEEIKSSFNIHNLLRELKSNQATHPYCLQLKTYGYFYYLKNNKIPELNLHLVSSRNFEVVDLLLKFDLNDYEAWLNRRLDELVVEAGLAEKRTKRRKKASKELEFPFAKPRAGQVELIQTIKDNMLEHRPMLLQAPTGLGKTVGVMYPTLQEALSRGQRLIYVTPKNSQHAVAEEAIEKLQDAGGGIKAMTLTAKSKMCFKNEAICNPDFCEYAKDHYKKVADFNLIEQLSKKKSLTAKTFKKMAEQHQVCPFELQLDASAEADAVICDYNYVFAPRSALGKIQSISLDQSGKPNLVIDEAHNLPSRAMDYYSPSLSTFVLEKMRDEAQAVSKKFRNDFKELLQECIFVVKKSGPVGCEKPCPIKAPVQEFLEQDGKLRTFLSNYLGSDVDIQPKDVVMRLSFYWSEFTSALEFVTSGRKEFFTTFTPNPATIKITCCDASEMLKDCYDDYEQVVGFSATLKPFNFYRELSGLAEKPLKTAEFKSPFAVENRKILIIPQISSKYSTREQNYPRIAEAIQKIASVKRGNYFVFLPSFDFLERVANQFQAPLHSLVIKQERYMKRDDIQNVMDMLKDKSTAHIIFAVQGGVFSEGVDYPGDMIIGAFVVGPPLPNFDLERETMKSYYEKHYSSGFDYAYTYPAMAKAVQAAGRVIRTETDRGIIVLMDDRFIQKSYAQSMPTDWFHESPRELVSESILKDVTDFWKIK
ncbi:MAG: ATP-dependent DNA helicase [Bdellovibrio sp.]|nr:ATP-dependent DNA helicase [Bdellovibrio sp.]